MSELLTIEKVLKMFGIFKSNPIVKLEKQYHDILEKAMQAQRSGNIRLYSELSEQAEGLLEQINDLKDTSKQP